MAKSSRARARKASNPISEDHQPAIQRLTQNAQDAALDALDELNRLRESLNALSCLENFLTPLRLPESDEFKVAPDELRALVICINAETQRRMQAVGGAIESMRRALH